MDMLRGSSPLRPHDDRESEAQIESSMVPVASVAGELS